MDVGILITSKNIKDNYRIMNLIEQFKYYNINAFLFYIKDVDFKKEKIHGLNTNFSKKTFNFPKYIYNFKTYKNNDLEIFNKLSKKSTVLLNYIGSKWFVHKNLMRLNCKYIIPTLKIKTTKNIITMLHKYNKICIKPNYGCRGKNIYFITKLNNKYLIKNNNKEIIKSKKEFLKYIDKFCTKKFIVQKYIESKTKENRSFDIRVHINKVNDKKWVCSFMYARVSSDKKEVSNIAKGGKGIIISKVLNNNLRDKIKKISTEIGELVDKFSLNEQIDLGLDLGIDKDFNIWLFEINSRPGLPRLNHGNYYITKNLVKYIKFKLGE